MKTALLAAVAAIASLSLSAPALAQGKGNGKGGAHANAHASGAVGHGKARTDARANVRAKARTGVAIDRRLDTNGNGIADFRERDWADANNNGVPDHRERRLVDINGNGVADWRERRIDRDRDGIDDRAEGRFGGSICPPGLAKKDPACVPPGQAGRDFRVGQRLPDSYRYYTDLDGIPVAYRNQIPAPYDSGYRYVYQDDRVYVVDPATSLIRTVIDLID